MSIVLASSSPRRIEILKQILGDTPFDVVPSSFPERLVKEKDLHRLCLEEALSKACLVAKRRPEDLVLAADTMVLFEGEQIGKPKDEKDAFETLRKLQDHTHEVVTAYALQQGDKVLKRRIVTAHVAIEKMADREIELYLETGSPLDKAGSYGIQDKDFIHAQILDGDESTVIGLPFWEVREDLSELGVPVADVEE
jgi:septum formation protein